MNEFDDICALLPFYVNGTLDQADVARVELALQSSADLRAELAEQEDIAQRIKQAGDRIVTEQGDMQAPLPPQPRPVRATEPQTSTLQNALTFLNPKRWAPAVALSLMVAVGAQAAMLSSQSNQIDGLNQQVAGLQDKFESAGGPCAELVANASITLELKDDASWQKISELLDTEQLTIINSGGFGVLTITSKAKGAELDKQVNRLIASPLVQSADVAK